MLETAMEQPASMLVWLLGRAQLLEGPEAWRCPTCGILLKWSPDCWPHCQAARHTGSFADFAYTREGEAEPVLEIPAAMVPHWLDLWEEAGAWVAGDPPNLQLRNMCLDYEVWLKQELDRLELKEKRYRAALPLQEALQAWQSEHVNKERTVVESATARRLLANQREICAAACQEAGEDVSVEAVASLLGLLAPDVVGEQVGAGIEWTLRPEILMHAGILEDHLLLAAKLDQARQEIEALARRYLEKVGRPSFMVKQLRLEHPAEVDHALELVGRRDGGALALANLLVSWSDTFYVVGYNHGAARWGLIEAAAEQNEKLHDRQFARFSGQKDGA